MIDCESGAAISFLLPRAVELSEQGMEKLTIRFFPDFCRMDPFSFASRLVFSEPDEHLTT